MVYPYIRIFERRHSNSNNSSSNNTYHKQASKMGTQNHKVVIVGGGFGGLGCVNGLFEQEDDNSNLSVTMLEPRTNLSIGACYQYVWTGRMDKQSILWPRSKLIANQSDTGVEIRTGDSATVVSVNVQDKTLACQDGSTLSWDSLVLAPGVISDPSLVPGLADSGALDVCALDQVDALKQELETLVEEITKQPDKPWRAMVSIAKVPYKCPPLPFEVVSLIDDVLRQHNVREKVQLILSCPVDFPFAGPPAKQHFCKLLEEMNIEFWNSHVLEEAVGLSSTTSTGLVSSCDLKFSVGGETKQVPVDCLVCVMPQRAPDFLKGLTNKGGFVPVDLQTNRVTNLEGVFCVGDACHAMFPAVQKPHPKAGAFAYSMGLHVGHQIKAQHQVQPALAPPKREASCEAEVGLNGKGVLVRPNFSDCLANPDTGKPKFQMQNVDNAASKKAAWVNGFLDSFFGKQEGSGSWFIVPSE